MKRYKNQRNSWSNNSSYDNDAFDEGFEEDEYEDYPEDRHRAGSVGGKLLAVAVAGALVLVGIGGYRLMSGILSPEQYEETAQTEEQLSAVSEADAAETMLSSVEETAAETDAGSADQKALAEAASAAQEETVPASSADTDPGSDTKAASADTGVEIKTASSSAEAESQTGSGSSKTDAKTESAEGETEKETKSASADTEKGKETKADSTDAKADAKAGSSEEKADSADSNASSSDSKTETKASSTASDSAKSSSADVKEDSKDRETPKKTWKEPEGLPEKITYSSRYAVGEAKFSFDTEDGTLSMEGGHPDVIGLVPPEELLDRSFWTVACSMPDTFRTEYILSHIDWIKDGSVSSLKMDGKTWDFTVNNRKQVTGAVVKMPDGTSKQMTWKYDPKGRLTDIVEKTAESTPTPVVDLMHNDEEEKHDPGLHIEYYGDWPGWFSSYGDEDTSGQQQMTDEELELAVFTQYGAADGEYRAGDGVYEIYDSGDGALVTIANTATDRYSTLVWMTPEGRPLHIEKKGPIRTWVYDTEGRLARIVGGAKGAVIENVDYICPDAEIVDNGVAWIGVTGEEEDDEDDGSSESSISETEGGNGRTGGTARTNGTAGNGRTLGTAGTGTAGGNAGTGTADGTAGENNIFY